MTLFAIATPDVAFPSSFLVNSTPVDFLTWDPATQQLTVSPVNLESADVIGNIVNTFNGRVGNVGLTSGDVISALGYTPGTGTVTSVGITGNDGITVPSGSPVTTSGNISIGLGNITPLSVNGLTLQSNFSGFQIGGGSIFYTLTVNSNATVSGTNTGDQTIELTGDVTGSGTGSFAATIATNAVTNAKFRQSAGLSVVGRSANSTGDVADVVAALDGQVLRRSGTAIGFGAIDLASANATTGVLPIASGGTGQSTYTNGQLLIGNTTGNTLTKATLTGTANQVTVTNGAGSITLSLPQSIGTSNDVLFRRVAIGQNFSSGGATNTHLLHIEDNAGVIDAVASITAYAGGLPSFRCLKPGGSFGSYSATPNNAIMCALEAQGHNGTTFTSGPNSRIYMRAAELFSSTGNGTFMQLWHTPIGSTSAAVYQRITSVGLYIGGDVSPTEPLDIYGLFKVNSSGNVTTGAWQGSSVGTAYGGTGQSTYSNGQLLIGNSTGSTLTKATLTGTSNQVTVTNGAGSITLSLPQDIATSSNVRFAKVGVGVAPLNALDVLGGVAIGSYAGVNTPPSNGALISGQVGVKTTSINSSAVALQLGGSSSATCDLAIDGASTSEKRILFYSGGGGNWALGTAASTDVFDLVDFGSGASRFAVNKTTGYVGLGTTSPQTKLATSETSAITGAVTDGYAAALTLNSGYSGAFTVTRHNYVDLPNPTLLSSTLTDAAVMRFNAAAGTHKAIDSGTTKTSPGTVSAWMKININGTINYIPCYTSKTS